MSAQKKPPERRLQPGLAAPLSERLKTPALAILLFGLNVYVCRGLFGVEYLRHMGSIEAAFIGISRYMLGHWRDLLVPGWFPLWYTGIPAQNTYPPLLHATVALAAATAGVSPAHAYHWVTALFYCLGPVTLFALVLCLSGSRWAAFFAGAFYSALSPAGWLIPQAAADIGGLWRPIRLRDLVVWGEGPHIASLTLLPLALLLLHRALDRKHVRPFALAAAGIAAVALTNWLGIFALALAIGSYLLARIGGSSGLHWRDVGRVALIAVAAYCLAMPWIPPSTIATIRENAQHNGGDFSHTYGTLPLSGAVALVALGGLKMILRRKTVAAQFAIFFTALIAAPPLLRAWTGIAIVPIPERYQLEMEMGVAMLAALAIHAMLSRAPRRTICIITAALVLALVVPVRAYHRFARGFLIQTIDITTTSEWKTAQWLNRNWTGGRVMLPGSTSFWSLAFSDTPQMGGGFDQGIVSPVIPMAIYQIDSGEGAGSKEAEVAILWFKALGVEAVAVSRPGSTEVYKPFRNPDKFEGVLEPLWRDGGDVLYGVPHPRGLAHVMRPGDLAARTPVNGIDLEPLRPYVAAIDDPQNPAADFAYTSSRSAAIRTELPVGDVISIQIPWHPGWHADVNGHPEPILKDGLGFMYLQPSGVSGPVQVTLTYDGGTEMRVARWLCGLTALLVAAYFFATTLKSMVAILRVSNTLSLLVGLLMPL